MFELLKFLLNLLSHNESTEGQGYGARKRFGRKRSLERVVCVLWVLPLQWEREREREASKEGSLEVEAEDGTEETGVWFLPEKSKEWEGFELSPGPESEEPFKKIPSFSTPKNSQHHFISVKSEFQVCKLWGKGRRER